MPRLPDPRVARSDPADHPWQARFDALADSVREGDPARAVTALSRLMRRALADGNGAIVASAVSRAATSVAPHVIRAADLAISGGEADDDTAVLARVFLLPVILVTAGLAPASVTGVVPDIGEITGGMRKAGALGAVEQFGLGNALGSPDDARAVPPDRLYRICHDLGSAEREDLLRPCDVVIDSADERVHVRLLAGVALSPAHAPTLFETAGPVGRWGMAVSRALARQLAVEGLSLLPLPRAPMPWYAALTEAAFAREEIAFNLFVTGTVRRIRAEVGEPTVVVAAHDDATLRVTMGSPFDARLTFTHAWPLGAAESLARVEAAIGELLVECRVADVQWEPAVLPAAAATPGGTRQ
ncbi:MAG: hypothetical protein U1F52_03120 [Burkholderiales bacterium]